MDIQINVKNGPRRKMNATDIRQLKAVLANVEAHQKYLPTYYEQDYKDCAVCLNWLLNDWDPPKDEQSP